MTRACFPSLPCFTGEEFWKRDPSPHHVRSTLALSCEGQEREQRKTGTRRALLHGTGRCTKRATNDTTRAPLIPTVFDKPDRSTVIQSRAVFGELGLFWCKWLKPRSPIMICRSTLCPSISLSPDRELPWGNSSQCLGPRTSGDVLVQVSQVPGAPATDVAVDAMMKIRDRSHHRRWCRSNPFQVLSPIIASRHLFHRGAFRARDPWAAPCKYSISVCPSSSRSIPLPPAPLAFEMGSSATPNFRVTASATRGQF